MKGGGGTSEGKASTEGPRLEWVCATRPAGPGTQAAVTGPVVARAESSRRIGRVQSWAAVADLGEVKLAKAAVTLEGHAMGTLNHSQGYSIGPDIQRHFKWEGKPCLLGQNVLDSSIPLLTGLWEGRCVRGSELSWTVLSLFMQPSHL